MYRVLNENYESMYSNADIMYELGEINVYDAEHDSYVKVDPGDIIKVCVDALYKIERDYPYLYRFLAKCKVMYIPVYPSDVTNTMAVDNNNNLWINMSYVYSSCKMSYKVVFGILFHELFHIFLDHIVRFGNKYPKNNFSELGDDAYSRTQFKANICMDYEVNASIAADGIVPEDFWEKNNCLYKKEYTGMTWEDIMDKYGDAEYNDWMKRNGVSFTEKEKKIIDAVDEAAKTLLDPSSTDEDKEAARKELKKEMNKILGNDDDLSSLYKDMMRMAETKLGDHGDIAMDLEELADDLLEDPKKMSSKEFSKTMEDIDKLCDEISKHSEDVGESFDKPSSDVKSDVEKARDTLKDSISKMREGKLSDDEKKDLVDKIKDAMDDIIANDDEKKRLEKSREERDKKKEEIRREHMKMKHPLRKVIIILSNLSELYKISLISEDTRDILDKCKENLEPVTEKRFGEMKKTDFRDFFKNLSEFKNSVLLDLNKLIDDKTILTRTKEDMKEFVDNIYKAVFDYFKNLFDPELDDDIKGNYVVMAARELRKIGKMLKTQKKWRVGEDFKKSYIDTIKRLTKIKKEKGDEALFKELYDAGMINPMFLDEKGKRLFYKMSGTRAGRGVHY